MLATTHQDALLLAYSSETRLLIVSHSDRESGHPHIRLDWGFLLSPWGVPGDLSVIMVPWKAVDEQEDLEL